MESFPSPVAAFAGRLRTDPEEPWLFHQRGHAWRWLSLRAAASRAEEMAASLASLPRGTRVGFRDDLSPAALVLDLALQAAGITAVPIAPDTGDLPRTLEEREAGAWAGLSGEPTPDLPPGIQPVTLPFRRSAKRRVAAAGAVPEDQGAKPTQEGRDLPRQGGTAGAGSAPGGAVVAGSEGPRCLSGKLLGETARSVAAAVGPAKGRDVTVLGAPLEAPLARLHLAWAILTGAALVLEPHPAALPATAVWARPTVLAGAAAELSRSREAWEESLPRRRREDRQARPFGRLRAWLLPASDLPPPAERSWWEERRVALIPVAAPAVV